VTSTAGVEHQPGLFSCRLSTTDYHGKPCLFLDRDGVLVEETHYLHRTEDVVLVSGVAEAIANANLLGVPVVMVTNQAGIGRGYYGWHDFERVQQHIIAACGSLGARWDMMLACAYHGEGIAPYRQEGHAWRKPEPGMLLEAARVLGVDLSCSHIVGDTFADLVAGARAGLPNGTLVLTGHGEREWREGGEAALAQYEKSGSFVAHIARDGAEAIQNWLAGFTRDANVA
jgi:D-glycero-D-manno-heptose 1,7-bisphosphate phosphatase